MPGINKGKNSYVHEPGGIKKDLRIWHQALMWIGTCGHDLFTNTDHTHTSKVAVFPFKLLIILSYRYRALPVMKFHIRNLANSLLLINIGHQPVNCCSKYIIDKRH